MCLSDLTPIKFYSVNASIRITSHIPGFMHGSDDLLDVRVARLQTFRQGTTGFIRDTYSAASAAGKEIKPKNGCF